MNKFWNIAANVFLVLLLVLVIFAFLFAVIQPFDHYKVHGNVYRTDNWSCRTDGLSGGETKFLVSCEKRDGSEQFSVMTTSFSVIDSMFEK